MAMPLNVDELLNSVDELLLLETKEDSENLALSESSLLDFPIRPRSEWEKEGQCKKRPQYFSGPQTPLVVKNAKQVCQKCPVEKDCLVWALLYREEGIWGGTTDSERKRFYSKFFVKELREKAREFGSLLEVPRTLAALLSQLRTCRGER
jgi:hypothetical protein